MPVVQTWHEYYPAGSGWKNIFNAVASGGLVVVRPDYLEKMPSWYRRLVARKHFRLIPNAAALPQVWLTPAERTQIRAQIGANSRPLVAYFGFVYPAKGVEMLTEIANPETDHLVIVADLHQDDPYHAQILQRLRDPQWAGRTSVTGFLEEHAAASILAAADAVVLPFRDGGGFWNTSVRAAEKQGVFVLTTSSERRGYDAGENTYYAAPGDLAEMREALRRYSGVRRPPGADAMQQEWEAIARAHQEIYAAVTGRRVL
jgi:glycosyltransferase involved in cell wall biosynthesis